MAEIRLFQKYLSHPMFIILEVVIEGERTWKLSQYEPNELR